MNTSHDIKRILILDDDSDFRLLLKTRLKKMFSDIELDEFDPVEEGVPAEDFDWDRYDVLLNAGFRYYTKGGPSVTMDYSNRIGREDYDEDTINLNLRWDF